MRRICCLALVALVGSSALAFADYAAQAALASDDAFIARVQVALVSTAIDVANENVNVPSHAARASYALQAVSAPQATARTVVWGVVADTTITAASTDAALKARVSAVWNTYAGAQ